MAKPKIATKIKQLAFSQGLIQTADEKSQRMGITFAEYMRYLIIRDNEENFRTVVTYPANLPPEVEAEYEKEAEELEEQIKRGEAKEYANMADLITDLDAE